MEHITLERLAYFAEEMAAKITGIFEKKEEGKGLSTNDYTNEEKEKLAGVTSNIQEQLNTKATIVSPVFTGIPEGPTAESGNNTTQLATTAFVKAAIDKILAASDAMAFKGTLGESGTVQGLPDMHKIGWTYKVAAAGTYAGIKCEVGDVILCVEDGTEEDNAHWTAIQANIDGAVTGPVSSVDAHLAVFDGATGKVIKDSGFTIGKSVPENAEFTDTTYGNATGSESGLMSAEDKVKLDGIAEASNTDIDNIVAGLFT